MVNIMCIDLEEWFHSNFNDDIFGNTKKYEVRVIESTHKLLNHFDSHQAKATFFVLGFIAEKHPSLIKEIHQRGHEIASHGYAHSLVYKQTLSEFREDVYKSKAILENLVGKPIKGYRAPSWSVTEKSIWALEVLQDLGFIYDSSIFPIETFLYGIKGAERFMHKPMINGKGGGGLYEIPPSTFKVFNKTMGFSGGFYFRALPFAAIKILANHINNKEHQPVIFYLHPREIDPQQPRLKLKTLEHIISYLNINGCEKKLVKTLKTFKCTSIERYYHF